MPPELEKYSAGFRIQPPAPPRSITAFLKLNFHLFWKLDRRRNCRVSEMIQVLKLSRMLRAGRWTMRLVDSVRASDPKANLRKNLQSTEQQQFPYVIAIMVRAREALEPWYSWGRCEDWRYVSSMCINWDRSLPWRPCWSRQGEAYDTYHMYVSYSTIPTRLMHTTCITHTLLNTVFIIYVCICVM